MVLDVHQTANGVHKFIKDCEDGECCSYEIHLQDGRHHGSYVTKSGQQERKSNFDNSQVILFVFSLISAYSKSDETRTRSVDGKTFMHMMHMHVITDFDIVFSSLQIFRAKKLHRHLQTAGLNKQKCSVLEK